MDFSSASTTKPMKSGTMLPATCGVGELFWKTNAPAGSNIYGCTATNTWTLETGGNVTLGGDLSGLPGAAVVGRIQGRTVSTASPSAGQALVWNANGGDWEPQTVQSGSSGAGAQFASGLGDFAVTRVSNTQVTIAANPNGTAVRCGGAVTVFKGTVSLTAAYASLYTGAVLYPYVDCTTNPATIKVDTGSNVVPGQMTLSGATFANAGASGYPPDTIPLPAIKGGATQDQFDATPFVDYRSFLSTTVMRCGTNLMRTANSDGSYTCGVDPTGTLTWTGAADLSGATMTKVNRTAAADPATCGEGESYYNLTAHQRLDCTGTNTWQASGGLLAFQPSTSGLGIGAGDTVIYSYTLPAGTLKAGACLTVELGWQTSTAGAGSVTPKFVFGSTSLLLYTSNNLTDKMAATVDVCNLPGYVTKQQINERALALSAHTPSGVPAWAAATENALQPVTMSFAVNGAGASGYTVTGLWFKAARN